MGTGSIPKNEHFMICLYAENHKISTLQLALLLLLYFNQEKLLPVLIKHFTSTLSLEDTQTW
jgi:hypothetical protein